MFDLETLATTADACIMSIGAVRFDLDSSEIDDTGFYASISIDSNLELKRRISEDTLIWWMKQGPEAQGVFHEGKQMLRPALEELVEWVGTGEYHVWSNGADFDLPMLAHVFTQVGLDVPWKFWNSRCFRTYKNLPGAKQVRIPATGVKHNALSDAHSQVVNLQAIHKALFSGKAHSMVKA
jgi:hypothetical protein